MTTTDTADTTAPLDPRLSLGIREAVERTLGQVCGTPPEIGQDASPQVGEGISAAIRYAGDCEFTLLLAVPRETAGPLMRTFTGVPIEFEAEIMDDVVGELLNVLAGDVVAELSTRGIDVQMGLPDSQRSLDVEEFRDDRRTVADLDVTTESGRFRVTVFAPQAVETEE